MCYVFAAFLWTINVDDKLNDDDDDDDDSVRYILHVRLIPLCYYLNSNTVLITRRMIRLKVCFLKVVRF